MQKGNVRRSSPRRAATDRVAEFKQRLGHVELELAVLRRDHAGLDGLLNGHEQRFAALKANADTGSARWETTLNRVADEFDAKLQSEARLRIHDLAMALEQAAYAATRGVEASAPLRRGFFGRFRWLLTGR